MRAEFRALSLVQRAFQQRAENGRLDMAPVAPGGDMEFADFIRLQRN